MIQSYARDRFPPIPAIAVSFAIPDSYDWQNPITAIIDSSADITIVPLELLRQYRAPFLKRVVLKSQWAERQAVHLHEVDIRIGESVLPGIDVAGDPNSEEVILGRNVLNRLDLRLEGPKLRTHILEG